MILRDPSVSLPPSQLPAAARLVALALGLVMVSFAAGGVGATLGVSLSAALVIGISGTLLAPIAWRVATKRIDVFEPIWLFSAAWVAMFVVRPSYMLATADFNYVRVTRIIDVRPTFDSMLALALLGAAAYLAGYHLPVGRHVAQRMSPPPRHFTTDTLVAGSVGLAVVGLGLFALLVYSTVGLSGMGQLLQGRSQAGTMVVQQSSSYLSVGPMLLVSACLVLFTVAHERRLLLAAGVGALVALAILALTVPVGARTTLLPLFGSAVIYFYLARETRPGLRAAAVIVAVALVGSALLLATRDAGPNRPSVSASAEQIVRDPLSVFDPVTKGGDAEMAPALAAALEAIHGDIPYMFGRASFGDLLTRPVPRSLWGGKPLPPREQVIKRLWPTEYEAKIANPEFSVLLVLILDAGVIGVAVGMAVFGAVSRAAYEYAMIHRKSLLVRLSYALALPFVVGGVRDSPVDTFVRMSVVLLPLWLIFIAASRRVDRHDTARIAL